MSVNASIATELLAVSRKFDELAATVERMQAGWSRRSGDRRRCDRI
jgi:hypothetical protein